jgi:hypothetical protein
MNSIDARYPLTKPSTLLLLPLLSLALASASCARGKVVVPEGATKTWDEMAEDERMTHMKTVVAPRMKSMFQEFDGERFADFSCETCHGPGAAEETYALPNPELPQLDESKYYKKHREATPEMVDFMWKEVEPTMAELLGVTHGMKGDMNCSSCHVVKGG